MHSSAHRTSIQFYEDYDIRYSIMGHIHFEHQVSEGGTDYLCACLGYKRSGGRKISCMKCAMRYLIEFNDHGPPSGRFFHLAGIISVFTGL